MNSKLKIPNARELFKSFKNARSEWRSKTPMQKWCYFYGLGKAPFGLVRIPLLNNVNDAHWFSRMFFVYQSILMLLAIYTISYFVFHGEFRMCLPCTCMVLIGIGVCKLILGLTF